MFYETASNDHGLRHDPFKGLAVPRPIGWVSSVDARGNVNLAPYSFFNAISDKPHYVVFGTNVVKDSMRNIVETGEFVCSMANYDLRDQQNITSAPVPPDVNEFEVAGLKAAASTLVKPPRVANAPVAFECKFWKAFDLPPTSPEGAWGYKVIFGYIVGIHIDDAYIKDGIVDTAAMRPLARLGYMDYAVVTPETRITINRPELTDDGSVKAG